METIRRLFEQSPGHFFFLGPRGTGKTTWVRERLPDALLINLLRPETYRELKSRPERLRELVLGNPNPRDIVLDEVQRVPELLPVVHDLIETERERRFVLTGSSARKLRRDGTNLLGGRAALRYLHPFMAAELQSFTLDHALLYGMVPLIRMSLDPDDTLRAYATLYIEQEVQAEGLTRRVGDFARFLEVISFSHAAQLNIANVAREAQVGRKTIESYVGILQDLLLAWQLFPFTRRAQRAVVAHPKFYFFDAGVYRSLRPAGPLDRVAEIDGAALEGLVAQHLRAWIDYTTAGSFELSYWRTRAGSEVDFIVYGTEGFWAIEVKNSATVRQSDVRSLVSLREDYPECTPMLLYRGENHVLINGVRCLPVEEFLRGLRPGRGLDDGL